MFADGSEISFDVHEAEILWDGRPRIIDASVADTVPLVGTSLLDGHKLTVRFVDGGDIFIEEAPRIQSVACRRCENEVFLADAASYR